MSTPERALIELARRELDKREARSSFEAFCRRSSPGYISAAHTRYIIGHLEALERGEIERLAIFLPPRHSKSFHASERFPAWFIGRNPTAKIIVGCHTQRLADKKSRIIRRIVNDESYPFVDDSGARIDLSADSSAVQSWSTTTGAELVAAGVGTAIAGIGADLLVIDDPISGREEADSLTFRNRVWDWYKEDARTRLMPDAREVFMVTRWHEDDLAGRILNGPTANTWTVVELPVYARVDDALGRAEGDLLWPGWLSQEFIAEQRVLLGARAFEAQYQQRPQPAGGLLFKQEWFGHLYFEQPAPTRTVVAVDGAWKEGVANDRSAFAHWGTDKQKHWPIEVLAGRWEYPDLRRHLVAFCERVNPGKVLIEDAASGTALIADLKRETRLNIVGVRPVGSKLSRAEAVTPLFEGGRILTPAAAAWKEDWLDEHLRFPAGTHDDQVDTTSMALADLNEKQRFTEAFLI